MFFLHCFLSRFIETTNDRFLPEETPEARRLRLAKELIQRLQTVQRTEGIACHFSYCDIFFGPFLHFFFLSLGWSPHIFLPEAEGEVPEGCEQSVFISNDSS